jgi:hypothetical protein
MPRRRIAPIAVHTLATSPPVLSAIRLEETRPEPGSAAERVAIEATLRAAGLRPVILTEEERTPKPSLAERLKAAKVEVAPRLGAASDALNASIVEFQTALADLKLGIAAGVDIEDDDNDENYGSSLVFRKHEGHWMLVIDVHDISRDERFSTTPLTKASRIMRLRASALLGNLLEALITRSHEEIDRVERSTMTFARFTDEIRGAKS